MAFWNFARTRAAPTIIDDYVDLGPVTTAEGRVTLPRARASREYQERVRSEAAFPKRSGR